MYRVWLLPRGAVAQPVRGIARASRREGGACAYRKEERKKEEML